jgi:undecaprenyl-diphosphatase
VNYQIFELLNSQAGRWPLIDHLMRWSALYLVFLVFSIGGAVVVHALTRHRIRPVVSLASTLALAFGLSVILGHASHEQRPFQDHPVRQLIAHSPGVSMPSDHATAAFAIAFGVLVFLSRRAGLALTVLALLIGVARVWCGVHYPGDILAGAVIAALATLTAYVVGSGPRAADSASLQDPPFTLARRDPR